MLNRLSITNYALIDELTVHFGEGLNIITGETGAGKSIIMGALSLILGARADTGSLRNTGRKCVIEGVFNIKGLDLETFFKTNDLDYDQATILRREILPSGKSRAFINDTPVNLQQLRELALRLTDIHSQHQNLELGRHLFQLRIVDVVANTHELLTAYQMLYQQHKQQGQKLEDVRKMAADARASLDYHLYQYNQLREANLLTDEQEELENEREKLLHAEEIKSALIQTNNLIEGDHCPVGLQLKEALQRLEKISGFLPEAGEFMQRIESAYIDLQDLSREALRLGENIEYSSGRLDEISDRLNLIYSLQQKHQVNSVGELMALRDQLAEKITQAADFEDDIQRLEKEIELLLGKLKEAALKLSRQRTGFFAGIESSVTGVLNQLGIRHAVFKIEHRFNETHGSNGADHVQFLFSANKNEPPDEISAVASGGEISRVMLALKTLVSGSRMISTIIFDEIDAGISGEVALKMGTILKKLSSGMQVINITHLPQVAGKGDHHYKVFKTENETASITSIVKLSHDERVEELAAMLGGASPSEAARKAAIELLVK